MSSIKNTFKTLSSNGMKSLNIDKMVSGTVKSLRDMAKETNYDSVLYNRDLLYILLIVVLINLFFLINMNDITSVTIFILTAFVVSFFSKNMIVILFIAFLVTHLYRYIFMIKTECETKVETMKNNEEDDEEKDNIEGMDGEEDEDKDNIEGMDGEEDEEKDTIEGMEGNDDSSPSPDPLEKYKKKIENLSNADDEDDEEVDDEEEEEEEEEEKPKSTPKTKKTVLKKKGKKEKMSNKDNKISDLSKDEINDFLKVQEQILRGVANLEPLLEKAENFMDKYEK